MRAASEISEVARRWQLGTDAHFTRSFKAAYGITPRAAREAALLGVQRGTDASKQHNNFAVDARDRAPGHGGLNTPSPKSAVAPRYGVGR